jgi:hypothetical protein
VTCLVARDGQGTPVGFLSGRLSKNDDSLPGKVAFVEMIGVVRGHGCRGPNGATPGELLIRSFGEKAVDTGSGSMHMVLVVGASPEERPNTLKFFYRLGFAQQPGADSPDRLCLSLLSYTRKPPSRSGLLNYRPSAPAWRIAGQVPVVAARGERWPTIL